MLPVPMSLNMARIHRDSEALTVRRNDLVARYAAASVVSIPLVCCWLHLDLIQTSRQ